MFTLNEDLPESLSPGETAKGAKVSEVRGIKTPWRSLAVLAVIPSRRVQSRGNREEREETQMLVKYVGSSPPWRSLAGLAVYPLGIYSYNLLTTRRIPSLILATLKFIKKPRRLSVNLRYVSICAR